MLAQAGKTPVVVDIDAFGLQNCFEINYEPDAGQTVALLNIGASVMNINIVRGGIPLFTRDVSVGGNQYTDALQKELDLSFDDAERLKKGDTLPSVTDEQKGQILRSVSDILTLGNSEDVRLFSVLPLAAKTFNASWWPAERRGCRAWLTCCGKSLRCRWKN